MFEKRRCFINGMRGGRDDGLELLERGAGSQMIAISPQVGYDRSRRALVYSFLALPACPLSVFTQGKCIENEKKPKK